MSYILPPVPHTWDDYVDPTAYTKISNFLKFESHTLFPPAPLVWNALYLTAPKNVKVVIIGQDPYHAPNQAMGLSFSVPKEQKIPPSLKNIYKELYDDMRIPIAPHGDLTCWAKQGVLLLNTALTVRQASANSHKNIGWHEITTGLIQRLSTTQENIVFMLWGGHAKALKKYIDTHNHCILQANHPSPLSANRGGFFGCKHFSQANTYLQQHHISPIHWNSHTDML